MSAGRGAQYDLSRVVTTSGFAWAEVGRATKAEVRYFAGTTGLSAVVEAMSHRCLDVLHPPY